MANTDGLDALAKVARQAEGETPYQFRRAAGRPRRSRHHAISAQRRRDNHRGYDMTGLGHELLATIGAPLPRVKRTLWGGSDPITTPVDSRRFGNDKPAMADNPCWLRPWGTLRALALALLMAGPAWAGSKLNVQVGWEGYYRPGRWSPIFVTASDETPREVVCELLIPSGIAPSMRLRQRLAIGPTPTTYALYAPLSERLSAASIALIDPQTGRRLIASPLPAKTGIPGGPGVRQVDAPVFIGISGNDDGAARLSGQFRGSAFHAAYLDPHRLPAHVIGYDAIDLLLLNRPDVAKLTTAQQQAVVDWVRGGGMCVLWFGDAPLPPGGPLLDALPVTVGQTQDVVIPTEIGETHAIGRQLTPRSGATATEPIRANNAVTYARDAGLGRWIVLSFDPSVLEFVSPQAAAAFWRSATGDSAIFAKAGGGPPPVSDAAERAFLAAMAPSPVPRNFVREALTGPWFVTVMTLLLVAGPLDWMALRAAGLFTTQFTRVASAVFLIVGCAGIIVRMMAAPATQIRSVRIVDQVQDEAISVTEVKAALSSDDRMLDLPAESGLWWRILPAGALGSGELVDEMPFYQDQHTNRPSPLLLRNRRTLFMEAQGVASDPIVQAALRRQGPAIEGTITNVSRWPLQALTVRTSSGVVELPGVVLAPGQSHVLARAVAAPPVEPVTAYSGLAPRRKARIDALLRENWACIEAAIADDSQAPLTAHPNIVSERAAYVRAISPLESAP